MTPRSWKPSLPVQILAVALGYFATAWLLSVLVMPPGYGTAIWPSAGLALAALLVLGNRVWPGVALGSFLHGAVVGPGTLASALGIGLGAALQAAVGAWLVRRFAGWPNSLSSPREVGRLVFLGCLSCAVNPTWATAILVGVGALPLEVAPTVWWTWWLGDGSGVLVFTPPLLLLDSRVQGGARRFLRVAVPVLVTFAVVIFLFRQASEIETLGLESRFEREASEVARTVEQEFDHGTQTPGALAFFCSNLEEVDEASFHRAAALLLSNCPWIVEVEWAPRVPGAERRTFEAKAGRILEPAPRGMRPAGRREEHLPVRWTFRPSGERFPPGFDLASEPLGVEFLALSKGPGLQYASAPVDLRGGAGCRFLLPVWDQGGLRGAVAATFDLGPLVDQAAVREEGWGLRASLSVPGADPRGPHTLEGPRIKVERLELAGRPWDLRVVSGPRANPYEMQAWSVLLEEVLFTGLLGGFMLLVTGQATLTQRLVEERTAELREALESVRTLSGLLPICAGCKNVRDDQGYWQKIEVYLAARTGAECSHGLCPACVSKLYPDFAESLDEG